MSIAPVPHDSWLSWFAVWRIPGSKYGLRRTLVLALVIFIASVVTYGMMYRLSLGLAASANIDPFKGVRVTLVEPVYSIEFLVPRKMRFIAKCFFAPAHWIDRRLRTDLWSPQPEIMSREEQDEILAEIADEIVADGNPAEIKMLEERLGRPIPVKSESVPSDEFPEP